MSAAAMTMNALDFDQIRRNMRDVLTAANEAAGSVPYPPTLDGAIPALAGVAANVEPAAAIAAGDQDNRPLSLGHADSVPPGPLGGLSKRLIDIAVAVAALTLAAPVILVIMAVQRLTMRGPIFFSHGRVGYNGRMFSCYKFRTMVANAQRVLEEHLANDPAARQEWEETQKLRRDPRITFFGQMLRKSSLDELPQLFNILRGDMSCVGPRPVVADELQRYGPFAADYLRTRPGLTGLWQVTGRNATDYSHRVFLDSQYVRNWSLWADIIILWRTVFAVMRFDQTS